ncbi:MAG: hypothetical protein Q4D21_04915 [Phascolarctobacterium sp.]|nr:hypothetical protein [Phascolarctobacterium sp.]
MMQLIVGLKVDDYKSLAKCVKIIRKFQNYSISEIKNRIDNNDYILCYDCADDVGVKNVISCYNQLTDLGVKVSLFELDHRPTTIGMLQNRDCMYDEISKEIDSEE